MPSETKEWGTSMRNRTSRTHMRTQLFSVAICRGNAVLWAFSLWKFVTWRNSNDDEMCVFFLKGTSHFLPIEFSHAPHWLTT